MFSCYEEFKKAIENESEMEDEEKDLLLGQYSLLFRRWKEFDTIIEEKYGKDRENLLGCNVKIPERASENTYKWEDAADLTLRDIFAWNVDFYNAVIEGDRSSLEEKYSSEKKYYTDPISEKGNIIDTFFCGQFPMLDVHRYELQMRAAKQLETYKLHMVFDEVGTGKTVTALYCVRDVLNEKKADAKILIVCPNNKKNEWQLDVRRQLGLFAHLVENGNEDNVYSGNCKELYFKSGEPCIFIEGQKKGQKNDNLNRWNESTYWDLIVIDEGHLCFDSYKDMHARKAILLTATPIIIHTTDKGYNIKDTRKFSEYIQLLKNITDDWSTNIQLKDLFAPKDCYTQLFREDLEINTKRRKISFVECDRWSEREDYLDVLSNVKGGMTRLIYEQDDDYLIYGIWDEYRKDIEDAGYLIESKENIRYEGNKKYSELKKVIKEGIKSESNGATEKESSNDNSYIIFFNHRWPAEKIFDKLKNDFSGTGITIGLKFGGDVVKLFPNDASVTKDNIFDELQSRIRNGKRVLFLTTGASGGTGLNLGDFHGVIHYELPFTCIELEQRFGRVDRMDKQDSAEKYMIFLINKGSNPMLYYSQVKLHVTIAYMPVRNTILFDPGFIRETKKELRSALESLSGPDTGTPRWESDKFQEFIGILNKIKKYEGKNEVKNIFLALEKNVKENEKSVDEMTKQDSDELEEFYDFISDKKNINDIVVPFYKIYQKLPPLKEDVKRWHEIIMEKASDEPDYSSVEVVNESGENGQNGSRDDEILMGNQLTKEKKSTKASDLKLDDLLTYYNGTIKQDFNEIEEYLEELESAKDSQEVTGIFFIKEEKKGQYRYFRKKVKEFRKEFGFEDEAEFRKDEQ